MPTKKKVTKAAKKAVKKATKKAVATKKTVKKAAKKTVKKATRSAKKAACVCKKNCKAEEAFWVNNGPVVESLSGLKRALKEMSDEQYTYHTKRDGNDFAQWIEHCLCDKGSASRVRKARSRTGAVRALAGKCSCR